MIGRESVGSIKSGWQVLGVDQKVGGCVSSCRSGPESGVSIAFFQTHKQNKK